MAIDAKPAEHLPATVPIGMGPPTREEMIVYYPADFTWEQMKTFVNSGDLGLLKRSKKLQARYLEWSKKLVEEYGSIVNYLFSYRLQWGQPDTISVLPSSLIVDASPLTTNGTTEHHPQPSRTIKELPPLPENAPAYFKADMPKELYYIAMNDWPYSVPQEVEHSLVWSRVPFLPPDLPPASESPLSARLFQDGLWGFTGLDSPPPSPSLLPKALSALADWGVTIDKLIRSPRGTEEEENQIKTFGRELEEFVKSRWVEDEWETAWFVNPPRLQSIPGVAHAHIFAKRKSSKEITKAGRAAA